VTKTAGIESLREENSRVERWRSITKLENLVMRDRYGQVRASTEDREGSWNVCRAQTLNKKEILVRLQLGKRNKHLESYGADDLLSRGTT
jgi:hypothetical protein